MVGTKHALTLPYLHSGGGVLEAMHAATFANLLRQPGQTVLDMLTSTDRQLVRETALDLILSTDLSKQGEVMGAWLAKKLPPNNDAAVGLVPGWIIDFNVDSDRRQFLKILLKAADVSNPAKALSLYLFWTNRILEEFYAQGDEEAGLGIPVTAMPQCDRLKPAVLEGQKGFISFVVKPVFESLCGFSEAVFKSEHLSSDNNKEEGLSEPIDHVHSNLQFWSTVREIATIFEKCVTRFDNS
jgi:hypothetical protein